MKLIRQTVPLLAILAAGACKDLQVPNYNAQGLSELQNGANLNGVGAAAVGLLATSRDFETSTLSSYISVTGSFGRESMDLDPSNPAHPVDRYDQIGTLEPGNAGFTTGYKLMKQGNTLLSALSTATGMTDAQKEGVRGFTKTIQALVLMKLLVAFDATGLPIDVDIKTTDPIAPLAPKAQVLTRIGQLLDDGRTSLLAAGSAFSFSFPAGFVSLTQGPALNTPPQFLKFNRALRARVAAYQATQTNTATPGDVSQYNTALTAIAASFIDPAAAMRFGAYDTYSTASGDKQNPLFDPTCRLLFANPGLEAGAQTNGGVIDARFSNKILKFTPDKVLHTYVVNTCFKLYPTADAPVSIIRNEELFLLRAEARWFTGDKVNAIADIDRVRQTSGGLGPSSTATPTPLTIASSDDTFITELLYNRLYSLIFEGGHHWADTRRFGRLSTLPKALPRSGSTAVTKVFPNLPLPQSECLPRGNPAAACLNPAPVP